MVVQDENRMLLPNELQSQADASESCADRAYIGPKEVPSSISFASSSFTGSTAGGYQGQVRDALPI